MFFFLTLLNAEGNIIAISYFDNTSGNIKFNALSKGIADMMITDLSKVQGITIVEREKLDNLINEIKLQKTQYFDQASVQKLGKGLGANAILTGSYFVQGGMMRIDARLINVQTGIIIVAEQVAGSTVDYFTIHKQLVNLLSKALKFAYNSEESTYLQGQDKISLAAVVNYSDALELFDEGLDKNAEKLLEQTIIENPSFSFAKTRLEELRNLLKELDAKDAKESAKLEGLYFRDLSERLKAIDFDNLTGKNLDNLFSVLEILKRGGQPSEIVRLVNKALNSGINSKNDDKSTWHILLCAKMEALEMLKRYDEVISIATEILSTAHPNNLNMAWEDVPKKWIRTIVNSVLEPRERFDKDLFNTNLLNEEIRITGDYYYTLLLWEPWEFRKQSYSSRFINAVNEKDYKLALSHLHSLRNQSTNHLENNLTKLKSRKGRKADELAPVLYSLFVTLDLNSSMFDIAEMFNDTLTIRDVINSHKAIYTKLDNQIHLMDLELNQDTLITINGGSALRGYSGYRYPDYNEYTLEEQRKIISAGERRIGQIHNYNDFRNYIKTAIKSKKIPESALDMVRPFVSAPGSKEYRREQLFNLDLFSNLLNEDDDSIILLFSNYTNVLDLWKAVILKTAFLVGIDEAVVLFEKLKTKRELLKRCDWEFVMFRGISFRNYKPEELRSILQEIDPDFTKKFQEFLNGIQGNLLKIRTEYKRYEAYKSQNPMIEILRSQSLICTNEEQFLEEVSYRLKLKQINSDFTQKKPHSPVHLGVYGDKASNHFRLLQAYLEVGYFDKFMTDAREFLKLYPNDRRKADIESMISEYEYY